VYDLSFVALKRRKSLTKLLWPAPDTSDSHTNAPVQGEWITLRVLLGTNGSELCAKKDGDTAFTRVTTSELTLPDTLFNVHVRQAWDFRYELETLRIQHF